MTIRTQKVISAVLISIVVVGGLQALVYILNLNQLSIFLHVAVWVYIYLIFKITLLYDLHFKKSGSFSAAKKRHVHIDQWLHRNVRIVGSAFWDRIIHLRRWEYLRHWLNYLILPALLYWPTVCILYLFMGSLQIQQLFVTLSAFALIFAYWHLKEIFTHQGELKRHGTFVALSVIKLYAAFLVFTAALGLTRHFCLDYKFLGLAIFAVFFLLMYQALFQQKALNLMTMGACLLLALIFSLLALVIYFYWGLNTFTAGAFLMVWYNFFWSLLRHRLEGDMTWYFFAELLAVSVITSAILLGATNFRAQIIGVCT